MPSLSFKIERMPINRHWVKEDVVKYTTEYYLVIKRNEMLLFVTTWMGLEGIMLSRISQTETKTNTI